MKELKISEIKEVSGGHMCTCHRENGTSYTPHAWSSSDSLEECRRMCCIAGRQEAFSYDAAHHRCFKGH